MPHDDDHPVDVQLGEGVEHVQDHRPAANAVQRLGSRRVHAGTLAGGENHSRERAFDHDV
jgi:hypothetical protein